MYIYVYIYVYVNMYIYIYVSPVPGSPHPPNGMVSCPLTPPSKPSICMLFAALQHLGDSLPYFENNKLVSGPCLAVYVEHINLAHTTQNLFMYCL